MAERQAKMLSTEESEKDDLNELIAVNRKTYGFS